MLIGAHAVLDAEGDVIARYRSRDLRRDRYFREGGALHSRAVSSFGEDALLRLGGFPADSHYAMDLDLMLRVASDSTLNMVACRR